MKSCVEESDRHRNLIIMISQGPNWRFSKIKPFPQILGCMVNPGPLPGWEVEIHDFQTLGEPNLEPQFCVSLSQANFYKWRPELESWFDCRTTRWHYGENERAFLL